MELLLICRYCDNKWTRNVYGKASLEEKCVKCGDTNIDVKELSKTKIDSYVGCPPFKEKEKEQKQDFILGSDWRFD